MLAKCQYQALTGVGAEGLGVDHIQGQPDLPPQVPNNVADVEKSIHPRSAQHITRCVKDVKSKDTSNNTAKQKIQGAPTHPGREQYEISRGPDQPPSYNPGSDYEFCEDSIHFVFNKGPRTPKSNNILFDEISNTQVLGDVKLANRAGKQLTQRFKLDSGACANLLPIGIYSKLFSKQDRDLKGSIDPRVSLIAANNNTIKQLGTVKLRVKAGGLDKVCMFFVVPNHCRPILGLPDLLRMDMVQFKIPTTNQWSNYVGTIESKVPGLTKDQILTEYKDVFTGLGRLKVDPIKIHLKEGAKPCRRPCRRVPIAMRQKFKDELDSLEHKYVLRKLKPNEVPEWLNSFVCPVKDDGGLRVCLDPTGLNPYIVRPVFNSHTHWMRLVTN